MHRDVWMPCLPFIVAMVASLAAARALISFSGARLQFGYLRQLHRDQRGAVQSLSFVLTLPVFVMLMLFIVQLSQLVTARLVVEYAAYAAARSARVWIPADLGDVLEGPNCIGIRADRDIVSDEGGVEFSTSVIVGPSRKLEKIQLAAAMALMPVCPSRAVAALPPGTSAAADSLEKAYQQISPSSTSNRRIPDRLRNKFAYALESTSVELEVRHRMDEPPLLPHFIPADISEFRANEIGWQDQLLVTVRHDFALLPGPARFLAKRLIRPGSGSDPVADRIRQRGSVYVYPLSATVRLSNEGEKSVAPYVQGWGDRPFATTE